MGTSVRDKAAKQPAPRWVKILGIIAVALILLVAIALATGLGGPGGHGPGRHMPGGDQQMEPGNGGGHVPPPGVPDHSG